jgi:hypothetical protein
VKVRRQILPDRRIREWNKKGLGHKEYTVCQKCNNTWMSDVENNHAKPCISNMIVSDSPVSLDFTCLVSISIFVFLKAIVGDHIQRDEKPFFSFAVRTKFRQSLSLPPNMQVWLGCLGALDPHNAIFRMKYGYTHPNVKSGMEIYTFTWGVGRLVIQLASLKYKNPRLRNNRIVPIVPPHQFWDQFAIPIWPPIWPSSGTAVVWPPKHHLSNSLLDKFSDRFAR